MFIFTFRQFKVTRDEVVPMIMSSIKAFYRFRRMGNMYVDINKLGFVGACTWMCNSYFGTLFTKSRLLGICRKIVLYCPVLPTILNKNMSYWAYRKKFVSYAPKFWKNRAIDYKNFLYAHFSYLIDTFASKWGYFRVKNLYMPCMHF